MQPLRAVWRHDETMVVSDNGSVAMFRNAFEQCVLTLPVVQQMLDDVGLRVVARYGGFDTEARPRARGDLILVAQHA